MYSTKNGRTEMGEYGSRGIVGIRGVWGGV